jgi:DedD protein
MPFFTFRRGGSTSAPPAASAAQAESVEVMRKRAKHRLIGSAVLVLIGVIGFPLLFDTQPRPVAGDIPIEIPGKNTVKPLTLPAPAAAKAPAAAPVEKVADAASLAPREEILSLKPAPAIVEPAPPAIKKEAKPEPKAEPKPEPKVVAKADPKPAAKPEPKPPAKVEAKAAPKAPAADAESARAAALLDGDIRAKSPDEAAGGRVVVQVGAFSDEAKAREARLKLEKAGLKTYTQVTETKSGKRIRVRVGPFASRADAEKAASKIKTLDLPAAILTL